MADRQLLAFLLGNELFGVDVLLVREIQRQVRVARVDLVPDHILGLMDLRGQLVTVFDLGLILAGAAHQHSDSSRCIVLKTLGEAERLGLRERLDDPPPRDLCGLVVDRVLDVVSISPDQMEAPANIVGGGTRYVEGVVKLPDRILQVLRVSELLAPTENVSA